MQDLPSLARGAEPPGPAAEEAGGSSLLGEEEDLWEGECEGCGCSVASRRGWSAVIRR